MEEGEEEEMMMTTMMMMEGEGAWVQEVGVVMMMMVTVVVTVTVTVVERVERRVRVLRGVGEEVAAVPLLQGESL